MSFPVVPTLITLNDLQPPKICFSELFVISFCDFCDFCDFILFYSLVVCGSALCNWQYRHSVAVVRDEAAYRASINEYGVCVYDVSGWTAFITVEQCFCCYCIVVSALAHLVRRVFARCRYVRAYTVMGWIRYNTRALAYYRTSLHAKYCRNAAKDFCTYSKTF